MGKVKPTDEKDRIQISDKKPAHMCVIFKIHGSSVFNHGVYSAFNAKRKN